MMKNPVVTALAGLLIGLMIGFVVGQGRAPQAPLPAVAGDPHAGVPGAPPISKLPEQPPAGGRAAGTANPRLMEQLREIEALVDKDPSNYQHRVQLANVHYDLGNYLRAIDAYEKARSLRDDSADVLTDLGVCYRETNQPRKAVELFDKAAGLAPTHWQSRYNAAVVFLFDLNDTDGAAAELEKLKAMSPPPADMPDLSGLEAEIAKRRG
jgi:cytochrome c-type biogenesis protein CcmH/NrfG